MRSIACNGRRLNVTPNLLQALKRLRAANCAEIRRRVREEANASRAPDEFASLWRRAAAETSGLPLWIDVICINQQDLEERSWQVAHMHRIFQHVHAVTGVARGA